MNSGVFLFSFKAQIDFCTDYQWWYNLLHYYGFLYNCRILLLSWNCSHRAGMFPSAFLTDLLATNFRRLWRKGHIWVKSGEVRWEACEACGFHEGPICHCTDNSWRFYISLVTRKGYLVDRKPAVVFQWLCFKLIFTIIFVSCFVERQGMNSLDLASF